MYSGLELAIFLLYILPIPFVIYYRFKAYKLNLNKDTIELADAIIFMLFWIPYFLWIGVNYLRKEINNSSEEKLKNLKELKKQELRIKYVFEYLKIHGHTIEKLDEYIESKSLLNKLLGKEEGNKDEI